MEDFIYFICAVIVLIITIIFLVKFFRLCKDVRAIREVVESRWATKSVVEPVEHRGKGNINPSKSDVREFQDRIKEYKKTHKEIDQQWLENLIEDFKENDIPVTEIKSQLVNIPEYVPKALADLMRANQVSVEDIENVVAQRGYFPRGTPLKDYPSDFIEGCLIGAWEQVYGLIMSSKDLPF